ncbi:MAG: MFS transporter [Leptospiraceae bacterium]|nr:MFS transporter [Leptospiraceae bacterium]MCK6381235.1 MFS transporter [Leptospiraceae bacterium]NUM42321.1 MFS transporter [Leptospiraceae bacterium]
MDKSNTSLLRFLGLGELANHGWRAILAFWMIIGMAFFLFGDQNLIAPNLKNIAHSFMITEQKDIDWYMGGLIPILFFILGGAVSLSMGYLAQKFSRKNLLLTSVLMGEIPCLLTAYSSSYTEFVVYRTLCGFGLGGMFPLLFSVIGDYFSPKSRATASAWISLAMGLGIGVGQLAGGILGERDPIDGWRTSFVVMALPSFLFAAVYAIFCKEPTRGGAEKELQGVEQDELSHKLSWQDVKLLFSNKTNIGIFLQGIPGCIPWGVFFVFLVDYYESVYRMGKTEATGLLTFAAIGVFLGTFSGGLIGQWLYNKKKILQSIFSMAMVFVGIIPCLYLLHAGELVKSPSFIFMNIVAGFFISLTGANVRAILISTNTAKTRSAIFSLYNLTDDLGKGLGPAISAIILGLIPDRGNALSISILFWIPCGLAWFLVINNVEKDEEAVHEYNKIEAERLRKAT